MCFQLDLKEFCKRVRMVIGASVLVATVRGLQAAQREKARLQQQQGGGGSGGGSGGGGGFAAGSSAAPRASSALVAAPLGTPQNPVRTESDAARCYYSATASAPSLAARSQETKRDEPP